MFEESQKYPAQLPNFNQSLKIPDNSPYNSHRLAVASKDSRVQIFSFGSLSPHLESSPVCSFKPRNGKITTSLKFFERSLYTFSAELLTQFDYA